MTIHGLEGRLTSLSLRYNFPDIWIIGCEDRKVRIAFIRRHDISMWTIVKHGDKVTAVALSSDRMKFISGSADKTALYGRLPGHASQGRFLVDSVQLTGHTGAITAVAFSPNDKVVFTGSTDNTIRLWDVTQAIPSAIVLTGHTGPITSFAISSDNTLLVSGSADRTARIWSLTKSAIGSIVLHGHSDTVTSVALSNDGKLLLTGSADKTVRLWIFHKLRSLGRLSIIWISQ